MQICPWKNYISAVIYSSIISYTLLEKAKNTLSKNLFRPQETHSISQKNKQGIFPIITLKVYGSVNSKRACPPLKIYPQAFVGHLSSCRSRCWGISPNISAQGWGICQIFQKLLMTFFFSIFHLKICLFR